MRIPFYNKKECQEDNSGSDSACMHLYSYISAEDILFRTRIAGILGSSFILALLVAILPLRVGADSASHAIAVVGILVAFSAGYIALSCSNVLAAVLSACLSLPFLAFANIPTIVACNIAILFLIDAAMIIVVNDFLKSTKFNVVKCWLLLSGFFFAWISSIALFSFSTLPLIAVNLSIPLLASISSLFFLSFPYYNKRNDSASFPQAEFALAAVLDILSEENGRAFLVDRSGNLSLLPGASAGNIGDELGLQFCDASIISCALIVDRVTLLHSIADATEENPKNSSCNIRIRAEMVGEEASLYPRFVSAKCSFYPFPGKSGCAMLIISSIAADVGEFGSGYSQDLSRVLHDFVSPFNVTLAYIDMILDSAKLYENGDKEYLEKAKISLLSAYSNQVLLGLWLRILHDKKNEREKLKPKDVWLEVVRLLHIEDALEAGDLCFICNDNLTEIYTNPLRLRLFFSAFVSIFSQKGGGAIYAERENNDLILRFVYKKPQSNDVKSNLHKALESSLDMGEYIVAQSDNNGLVLRFNSVFDECEDINSLRNSIYANSLSESISKVNKRKIHG